MNTLPNETFVAIISYLPLQDKLNCIHVCHRWFQIISNSTCLYGKLEFKETLDKFHQAFALFDNEKATGRTTQHLEFCDFDLDVYSIFSLPKLFPNVKQLKWEEDRRSRKFQ
jgi:hypothetical protein